MKLIVAEDDVRIAGFLERGLRAEGYHVQLARTGPEALAAAQDAWAAGEAGGEDTLVLLDLMLPGLSGLEVCQTLRAAGVALARRGRGLKPARPPQLVLDDLVFDRAQMRASRGGQPLQLTARELALLELLMSAPGRLFSRERILATVWGTHEDPLTNVVDVFIRRLRAKIDDGHPRPLIHTVRGMGYRLEALPPG